MTAQIVYLVLLVFTLCDAAYRHGKPRTGRRNFIIDFIALFLQFILMYWGGFFDVIINKF